MIEKTLIEEDTYPLELHNFHYAWAMAYHDDHIPLDRNYLDRKPWDSSKKIHTKYFNVKTLFCIRETGISP